jgi:hypothetical protein
MPKPIVCLSEQLRQFVEIFHSCFSKRQWKYFVIVLLGLIECEERKTMSGLLRMIGEQVSLSGLSRFLNKWSWSATKVAQSWLLYFRQRMAPLVRVEHSHLKDTVGKPGRGGKMRGGGWHVFKNTITVGNAGRNGTDREAVVARE